MVDIQEQEEKKELTLEDIIKSMMERIQRLEATIGYIIHIQKIAPPKAEDNADA